MIFDPILLGLLGFICVIVMLFVILFLIGRKKSGMGEPLYKTKERSLEIFNITQPIIKSNLKFTATNKKQDTIFNNEFSKGKMISIQDDKIETISRVVKVKQYDGLAGVGFGYIVYFEDYEFIEFPIEIEIKNCLQVDWIKLSNNSLSIFRNESLACEILWEDCRYDNTMDSIELFKKGKSVIRLHRNAFEQNEDINLENILEKYSLNLSIGTDISI